jgi:hypothetical protein
MDNILDFFTNFPRPIVDAQKVVSSPTTLTWQNFESMKILKGEHVLYMNQPHAAIVLTL